MAPHNAKSGSIHPKLNLRWLAIALAFFTMPAVATKPADIKDAEMAMLPKYCPDTMGFNYGDAYYNTSPRAKYWVSVMGKDFWNVHHYCWAQINRLRATKNGVRPEFRRGKLEEVRSDYLYVIEKAKKDFVLLPEILTRLGEIELLLEHVEAAGEAFARARSIKPDYWPAYSGWAEYLIKIGKRNDASILVKTGLEYVPSAKVLQEQYRLLGGKLSEIVPRPVVVDTAPESEEVARDEGTEVSQSSDSGGK